MFFNMLIHHRQSLLPFTSNKSSALLQNSSQLQAQSDIESLELSQKRTYKYLTVPSLANCEPLSATCMWHWLKTSSHSDIGSLLIKDV